MQKKLSPWCKKAKIAMIQNDIHFAEKGLITRLKCCLLQMILTG